MKTCCVHTTPARIPAMTRRKPKPPSLDTRIRVVMAERGVRSITALSKLLRDIGVDISVPQLGRMIDGKTQYLRIDVLAGLVIVLDCRVGDLFSN